MHFALLVPELPYIREARAHYDSLLTLRIHEHKTPTAIARWWTGLWSRAH